MSLIEEQRRERIDRWAQELAQRCVELAKSSAVSGEHSAEFLVVDQEDIKEGEFFLSDGRRVSDMEAAIRLAVERLTDEHLIAQYIRKPSRRLYDEGDLEPTLLYFKPIIALSGW